jgi:hypothetical protein
MHFWVPYGGIITVAMMPKIVLVLDARNGIPHVSGLIFHLLTHNDVHYAGNGWILYADNRYEKGLPSILSIRWPPIVPFSEFSWGGGRPLERMQYYYCCGCGATQKMAWLHLGFMTIFPFGYLGALDSGPSL